MGLEDMFESVTRLNLVQGDKLVIVSEHPLPQAAHDHITNMLREFLGDVWPILILPYGLTLNIIHEEKEEAHVHSNTQT